MRQGQRGGRGVGGGRHDPAPWYQRLGTVMLAHWPHHSTRSLTEVQCPFDALEPPHPTGPDLPLTPPHTPRMGASRELSRRVEQFVLRRTADINRAYLPPLTSHVAFVRPTPLQLRLYSEVLRSGSVQSMLGGSGSDYGDQVLVLRVRVWVHVWEGGAECVGWEGPEGLVSARFASRCEKSAQRAQARWPLHVKDKNVCMQVLSVISNLRKICNHPSLYLSSSSPEPHGVAGAAAGAQEAAAGGLVDPMQSGKVAALMVLLRHIIAVEHERCVVVSEVSTQASTPPLLPPSTQVQEDRAFKPRV